MWKKIEEIKSSSQQTEAAIGHHPPASTQGWAMTTMGSRGPLVTGIMAKKRVMLQEKNCGVSTALKTCKNTK